MFAFLNIRDVFDRNGKENVTVVGRSRKYI